MCWVPTVCQGWLWALERQRWTKSPTSWSFYCVQASPLQSEDCWRSQELSHMPKVSRPPPGIVDLRIWASQILDQDFFHLLHFANKINLQQIFFKYFFQFIYLFVCFLFLAVLGLRCCALAFSSCSKQCTGFSLSWPLPPQSTGSRHTGFSCCGSRALERRLSSCGTQA